MTIEYEETCNKCFNSRPRYLRPMDHAGFEWFYVRLACELRNVRYANYLPVYHSISSFDRTLEMDCSTRDIQRQTTIKC